MAEPIPIGKVEEIRRDTVARLRWIAEDLERAPRHAAADFLVRVMDALEHLDREARLVLRRGRGPGAA